MSNISELKVERYPIMINYSTCALLTLYHSASTSFTDLWAMDYDDPMLLSKNAARQFIDRLEDHYNAIFLQDLRDAITERLDADDEKWGSSHAKESNLENWEYKKLAE